MKELIVSPLTLISISFFLFQLRPEQNSTAAQTNDGPGIRNYDDRKLIECPACRSHTESVSKKLCFSLNVISVKAKKKSHELKGSLEEANAPLTKPDK